MLRLLEFSRGETDIARAGPLRVLYDGSREDEV